MRPFSLVPLACLMLLAGCGMPDYEKRMDAQNERIAKFDAVNQMLDDPIDMTATKKDDGKETPIWRFPFFLRLPKGYGTAPKDPTPYYDPFPCYRYANNVGEQSILVAANLLPDAKGKEKVGEYHANNFRSLLRVAIAEYYAKSTKNKLILPDKAKWQERVVVAFHPYPDLAPKMKYDFVSYNDQSIKQTAAPTQFDVYLHEAAGKQVCVIVQHPPRMQNFEAFNKSIEACLSTLDSTAEAGTKRSQFKRGR